MRLTLSILLLISFFAVNAQRDSSGIICDISLKFLHSSIWTGRGSLQPFTKDHPWSLQIDFGILKNSQKAWNYCNCYSRNGVSAGYINFDNSSKLGSALTFSFFTEPMLILRNRFSLSARGDAGFAFLNKVYDSISNKESIFFSANFSYYLALGVKASYQLNKDFKLSLSSQFNHISNGGRKDPNEGMNFPSVNLGLSYAINSQKLERRPIEKFEEKTWSVIVHLFGAPRVAPATAAWPEEKRLVAGMNMGVIKRIGRLNAFGAGGEIYYDGIKSVNQQRSGFIQPTTVAGIGIQHYLFLGKLVFGQQFVRYITPNTNYRSNYFQRYLLEYEVKKNWYAGVSLKTHGEESDYLVISIGHLFKLR
jgi:hypothetical protein